MLRAQPVALPAASPRDLAAPTVSYGYRRVHVLLRRKGWPINLKRVLRLHREEGLCLRSQHPKRRRSAVAGIERPAGAAPNERWSKDFMSDALASGHKLRVLTVLDTRTRECVALEVATGVGGQQVADVLTRVGITRGLPAVISVACYEHLVQRLVLELRRPLGSPIELKIRAAA